MTEMHHDPLGDIPDDLRPLFDGPRRLYRNVSPPTAAPMLSTLMAMGLTNDKGDLPVTAASNANEPAAQAVGLPKWRTTLRSNKERVMSTIAAFIGTTVGKVVLGTAVAAASVGTGQAVGVLDVPGLSNETTAPVVETEHDDDAVEAPDCSDQADVIEEAAEGQGDAAEDAASEEADAFEDACELADEAAEDAESDDDADDVETDDDADEVQTDDDDDESDDDLESDDELETDDDEVDEVDEVDDDADEVETDDDADEVDEVETNDDDLESDDDDADEVDEVETGDDHAGEVETREFESDELDADDESDDIDD